MYLLSDPEQEILHGAFPLKLEEGFTLQPSIALKWKEQ